ncbi:MAG TPA: site-specific integrase [Pedobacter sp.]|jgi:integrase
MLEKSFGLLFFLKQSKNQKNNERYVYLRITVDGTSKELSTKRMWDTNRWNQSSGRALGTKEDAKSLNVYLDSLSSKIFQAKRILMEADNPITADTLKNFVTGQGDTKRMVLKIFDDHNRKMKSLVGTEFAPGTMQRYQTSYDHTKAFIRWKYSVDDLEIKDLNYEFVSDYAYWLKGIRKCNHNSSMKYLANFKKIVLECIKKGWITSDPFIGFKTTRKEVVRVALTNAEINSIATKKFDCERLEYVKDIFIFSCYTGLAYIDVKKLRRSQIVQGADGEQWIITKRQKTDSPTRLPILPVAMEIMNKYKDHPKCSIDDYVLPVLTNQKMNAYLKEIADTCGINKNLTFHIARHTFATTITLSNGVPIETVSKMLGHKSLKQTQHYAKILDLKISEDMATLKNRLSLDKSESTKGKMGH